MKKHLPWIIACAFVSPLIATNAAADGVIEGSSQMQSQGTLSMERLDTNGDNVVSRGEAQIGAGGTVLDFMTVDADGDGQISGDELSAARNNSYADRPDGYGAAGGSGPAGADGSSWSTTPQTSKVERDATTPADATPPLDARTDPTRPTDATPENGRHYLDPRFGSADEAGEDYSRIRGAAGSAGPVDPREFDPRRVDPLQPGTANGGPKETISVPPVRGSGGGGIEVFR